MNDSLVNFRVSKKLTQKVFADTLRISLSLYAKVELGFRTPSFDFIRKLKETYPEANIDKIFFGNKLHTS